MSTNELNPEVLSAASNKESGKRKFSNTQLGEIRSIIAALDRRGYTQVGIVQVLRDRHGIQLSQPMVSIHLKRIREEYAKRQWGNTHEAITEKLDQLREVRKMAWEAYDRSTEDATKCVEESESVLVPAKMLDSQATADALESAARIKRIITVQGRLPDSTYLNIILDTLREESKLRALYPDPKQPQGQTPSLNLNIDINMLLATATKQTTEQKLLEITQNSGQGVGSTPESHGSGGTGSISVGRSHESSGLERPENGLKELSNEELLRRLTGQ